MAEVGTAFVSVLPSAKGFGSKLDSEVGGDLDKAGKSSGKKFGNAIKVGALGVLAGGAVLAKFLGDSVSEAREAQKVGALTESIIKSTGGAANVTARQVGDLATAISNKTGMDDEAIQSGANLLLTFKQVRNELGKGNQIFDRATQAAADLSAAGFGDMAGQSKMLGKALNDPIKGITALSRSGVTFTAQQQEQIKTLAESGQALQAQKIILGEVESQVGGAAAASATAGEKAAVAFGNLKEQVGTALLPVIDRLANAFTGTVVPAISGFISGMQTGAGAGGAFVANLRSMGATLATVGGFLSRNRDFIIPFVAALAAGVAVVRTIGVVTKLWAGAQAALNIVLTANPIGIIVVALAALGAALVVAYKRSETFRNIVNDAFAGIRSVVAAVMPVITAAVRAGMIAVQAVIRTVTSAARALWDRFGDDILKIGAAVFRTLSGVISGAMRVIQGVIKTVLSAIRGDWSGAWDGIRDIVSGATRIVTSVVRGAMSILVTVGRAALREFLEAVRGGFQNAVAAARALPGQIRGALGAVGSMLYSVGRDMIAGLISGIKAMASSVASAAKSVVSSAISAAKSALKIHSPSRVFDELGRYAMEGLQRGIEKGGKKAVEALQKVIAKAREKGQELKSVAGAFSESVTTSLEKGDLFGAGAAGLVATLASRGAEASAMLAALGTASTKGLDGGLYKELAASGDVTTAQEIAAMSAAQIDALEKQFNATDAAINKVAEKATDAAFGQQLTEQSKLIRDLQAELKKLPKAVRDGAEDGTHKGNADKDKQTNQRARAGR